MTGHDKHNPDLPLPSPRSPDSLDERILTRARDNVATEPSSGLPHWVTGIATVGIAGLAVLLALPVKQGMETEAPQPTVMESPVASPDTRSLQVEADTAEDSAVAVGAAAPTGDIAPEKHQVKRVDEGMASARKRAELKAEAAKPSRSNLPAPKEKAALADSAADPESLPGSALEEAAVASSPAPAFRIEREELEAELQRCGELLANNGREAADTCYAELLKDCNVCDLPPRLEDALKMLPPETKAHIR